MGHSGFVPFHEAALQVSLPLAWLFVAGLAARSFPSTSAIRQRFKPAFGYHFTSAQTEAFRSFCDRWGCRQSTTPTPKFTASCRTLRPAPPTWSGTRLKTRLPRHATGWHQLLLPQGRAVAFACIPVRPFASMAGLTGTRWHGGSLLSGRRGGTRTLRGTAGPRPPNLSGKNARGTGL